MDELLRESLAELEHEQWWNWATTICNQENISDARYNRWSECFVPYNSLSDDMKDHDRKWADKALEIVKLNHAIIPKKEYIEIKKLRYENEQLRETVTNQEIVIRCHQEASQSLDIGIGD